MLAGAPGPIISDLGGRQFHDFYKAPSLDDDEDLLDILAMLLQADIL